MSGCLPSLQVPGLPNIDLGISMPSLNLPSISINLGFEFPTMSLSLPGLPQISLPSIPSLPLISLSISLGFEFGLPSLQIPGLPNIDLGISMPSIQLPSLSISLPCPLN